MEKIDIAFASDAAYFPGLLVTAASLARAASRDVSLRFNVLDGGIGEENLCFLRERLSAEHPHAEMRVFPVDDARFESFRAWNGTGRMAYARLVLPELMRDVDFVIYCDVDFLWFADVAELWAVRNDKVAIMARRDAAGLGPRREAAWFRAHGLPFPEDRYICSGLMLMNLVEFRERCLSESVLHFLHEHPDVQYVDQTAINAVVADIELLPMRWGAFAHETEGLASLDGYAVHFAGSAPWCSGWWTQALTGAHEAWYRFYGELVGLDWRASRRRFLPWRQIVARRAAWIIVRHAALRIPFFMLLRLMRRGCYIAALKEMAK